MEAELRTKRNRKKISVDGFWFWMPIILRNSGGAVRTKKWRMQDSYSHHHRGCRSIPEWQSLPWKQCSGRSSGQDLNGHEATGADYHGKKPDVIINSVLSGINQSVMGQMPNKDANRKIIQRVRKRMMACPNPINLAELIIPEEYQYYEPFPNEKERFLSYDTGSDDTNRILLFGRDSHKKWSHQIDEVFMDGTFSLSPPLF